MKSTLTAVNLLLGINILLFFASSSSPDLLGALALYFPENPLFAPWQFVTHMFMHGGIAHLLFNMLALWMFGLQLETLWGRNRFLFFYFACGVGAALIYTAIHYYQFNAIYELLSKTGLSSFDIKAMLDKNSYPPAILNEQQARELLGIYHIPMVGASGAIYGVLVAYAFIFPNNKLMLIFLPFPVAAKYFVPAIIALDLFSGITGFSIFGGGVAHFAHVGGALIGFLLMLYWRSQGLRHSG